MATRDWLKGCIADAANAPDVTEQVHGMAIDIRDLKRIARLEAHLDAKLQRPLTLLRQQWRALPPVYGFLRHRLRSSTSLEADHFVSEEAWHMAVVRAAELPGCSLA